MRVRSDGECDHGEGGFGAGGGEPRERARPAHASGRGASPAV